jgi:hypothetical protein
MSSHPFRSAPSTSTASMRRAAFVVRDHTLRPHERRRWRAGVFITALFILPRLIEGLCRLMPHADVLWPLTVGVHGLVAVAAPIALVVLRRHLDRRLGCFAGLVSSTVFFGTFTLAILLVMATGNSMERPEWVVVVIVAYVLRVGPIIVIARGLHRLVGAGLWRDAIGVLVIVNVALHITSLANPPVALPVVEVVLAVGLLLAAVCSQPAFEEHA